MLIISINGRSVFHLDQFCADDNGQLIYLSMFSYQNNIDFVCKSASKTAVPVNVSYRQYTLGALKEYNVFKYYDKTTDVCHFVALKKEKVVNNIYYNYYLTDNIHSLKEVIYRDIVEFSSIPLLPEWCEYLMTQILLRNVYNYRINCFGESTTLNVKLVRADDHFIYTNVVRGLNNGDICIDPIRNSSSLSDNVSLDEYLNINAESLTDRIKENFYPKFNPISDEHRTSTDDFEDYAYNDSEGIQLFDAQKSIIAASVNNLDKEHVNIVVGECGTGKTCIGAGITYCHGKQLGYNAIIMCPAQLVEKWQREILAYVPNAKAYIVENISDVAKLDADIRNKNKKFNLYMIMSQETAKFSYYEMPCVSYNNRKGGYVCPKCGKLLNKTVTEKIGRKKYKMQVPMVDTDFNVKSTESSKVNNIYCTNMIDVYNVATNKVDSEEMCKEPLWRPITRDEVDSEWLKIGKAGWFKKDRIRTIHSNLAKQTVISKSERELLFKLDDAIKQMDEGKELKIYSLYKYPVAKYIKNNYKGLIDYFVCDEVHEVLAKDSLQAKSFGDLSQAAVNNIALTGTLINGYATSLFYLLYRLVPRKMRKLGFEYKDINSFLAMYGSFKTVSVFGKSKDIVKMPGVSPLLFSDFLLDVCAFISLDDVAEGLPGYQEIPVPVNMSDRISAQYDRIVASMKENIGYHSKCGNSKSLTQYIQLLYTYPDQPYDHSPIVNVENNSIIFTPVDLHDEMNEKLDMTVNIVKRKIEAGEKVLIYYHWSNKTDIKNIIKDRLQEEGFNVAILETNTVAKKDREKWLKSRKDIDVLLCNPKLVDTGLDLFDFTTIIYYQLGNKIFTMRQASRRSWRLGQTKDVEVYFIYYASTVQQDTIALMAAKLQASLAIEGKCSSEGLHALSANEDITTKITNSVLNGISQTIDLSSFDKNKKIRNGERSQVVLNRRRKTRAQLTFKAPTLYKFFKKSTQKRADSSDAIFAVLKQKNVSSLF